METVLFFLIGLGVLAGGMDLLLGNRFGLGKKFTEGVQSLGPLTLGMTGIICLSPLAARLLRPLSLFFMQNFHVDGALLGSLLACDMGGYALSREMAASPEMGSYAGMIVASMLGCTLSFLIPVGLNLIPQKDIPAFFKGIMFGLTGIFPGSVLGGIWAGYAPWTVVKNTLPVLLLSGILMLGLLFKPGTVITGCRAFGKGISAFCYGGLMLAGFQMITGKILLPGMEPVENTMVTIGKIGVFLMGALPAMEIFRRMLQKIAVKAGREDMFQKITGYLFTLINPLPVLLVCKNFREAEIIRQTAFMVCASCTLGDHLGFAAGTEAALVLPLIAGKLAGGLFSLFVEYILIEKKTG